MHIFSSVVKRRNSCSAGTILLTVIITLSLIMPTGSLFSRQVSTPNKTAEESLRQKLGFIPTSDQLTPRSGIPASLNIEDQPMPPLALPSVSRSEHYRVSAAEHINKNKGFLTEDGYAMLPHAELKDALLGKDTSMHFGIIRYDIINLRGTYRYPKYYKDDYHEFYLESHIMGFPHTSIYGMESPFTIAYRSRGQIIAIFIEPQRSRTVLLAENTGGASMMVLERKWSDGVFQKKANLVPFARQIPEDFQTIAGIEISKKTTLSKFPEGTLKLNKMAGDYETMAFKPAARGWCLHRTDKSSFVIMECDSSMFSPSIVYLASGLDMAEVFSEQRTVTVSGVFPTFITGWLQNESYSIQVNAD
ncbi:MAG: hypothetical protein EPN93_16080 [Spirochaetes bacterium]|nr:MAG: hypothetical protein EPN93_16080 [Spirochaetota bacterium]